MPAEGVNVNVGAADNTLISVACSEFKLTSAGNEIVGVPVDDETAI